MSPVKLTRGRSFDERENEPDAKKTKFKGRNSPVKDANGRAENDQQKNQFELARKTPLPAMLIPHKVQDRGKSVPSKVSQLPLSGSMLMRMNSIGQKSSRLGSRANWTRKSSSKFSKMNASCMSISADLLTDDVKSFFSKQVKKIQSAYNTLINNLKKIIYKEAANFVMEQGQVMAKLLTAQHHRVITTFLEQRQTSASYCDKIKHLESMLMEQDLTVAKQAPCLEASFSLLQD